MQTGTGKTHKLHTEMAWLLQVDQSSWSKVVLFLDERIISYHHRKVQTCN